jgi:hypothetical protein
MPKTGGYADPLKFVLICLIPNAVFMGLLYGGILSMVLGPVGAIGLILGPLIIMVTGVIAVFIISILVHIGVIIFAGQNKGDFEATFRIVSYVEAIAVVSWIPFIGSLLALYGIYLAIVGIMKVHKTSAIRAILAYFGLMVLVGSIVAALVIVAIYSDMSSQGGGAYQFDADSPQNSEEIQRQIERELERMEREGTVSLGAVSFIPSG